MQSDFPYSKGSSHTDCIERNSDWEVYRGTDASHRPIIWKEFHFYKEDFSLQREIRLQSNVEHRYIAPVLASKELSREKGKAHFAMIFERFPYELEQESRKGLSEGRIVDVLGMAISALVHLQNEGIAHRDIKPENLYLAEDWTLRVGDFGTAKEYISGDLATLQGTPLYMSPLLRQAKRGVPVSHNPYKSDVFSLGITCLQLAQGRSNEQLEEWLSYDRLTDLPSAVYQLPQSDQFKQLLLHMLQYEESLRPDFFQLMYLYASSWPEKRAFFAKEPIRYCEKCGNLASLLCTCTTDLPSFCLNCHSSHETGPGHTPVQAFDIHKVKRQEDITRLRERERIIEEIKQSLESFVQDCEELAANRSRTYEHWIDSLTRLKQQEMERIRDIQTRASSLSALVETRFQAQKLESTLLFEFWKSITPPYAKISTSQPSDTFPFGEIHLSDDKMRELEGECKPVGPLFFNNKVAICCLQNNIVLRTFPITDLGIDAETAIVLVRFSTVAGCGSVGNPLLCFTFSLIDGYSQLGSTLSPHLHPAIIASEGKMYAFGGNSSLKAEEIALFPLSPSPLPALPYALARGSACEHQGTIYLPALLVLCYTIESATYRKCHTLQPFSFVSLLVHAEKLYAFSDQGIVEKALNAARTTQKDWKVGFQSLPAPIILGNCVFFFNSADGYVAKYEL